MHTPIRSLLATLLLLAPLSASGLDILLTNDDGFDADGITTLRQALIDAGHDVTVVAPAVNQSGKGGSINTAVFDFDPSEGLMTLTHHGDGVYSLTGTPADCVKAGLDVVLADDPPDLVVSGLNEGQNLGKPGTNTSGTEGAALRALFSGVPAIAGSVGLLFEEQGDDFPSTVAAYEPASDFIVRTIDRLVAANGSRILPKRVGMLNINFPVPYEDIQDVEVARLGDGSDIDLPLFDPSQGFPAFGIPPLPFPACGGPSPVCFVAVGVGFSPDPDPVRHSDVDAFRDGSISITPMDGDMTAGGFGLLVTAIQLHGLAP